MSIKLEEYANKLGKALADEFEIDSDELNEIILNHLKVLIIDYQTELRKIVLNKNE